MSLLPESMNRIRSRTAEKKLQHRFSNYKSMRIFSDALGQLILPWSDLAKFRTPPSSHACHCYLQVWEGTDEKEPRTRFDVYETLCPQQMLVHKGGQIKNWSGECRDVIPTKLQCLTIQRSLESPNLQREIIRKNK